MQTSLFTQARLLQNFIIVIVLTTMTYLQGVSPVNGSTSNTHHGNTLIQSTRNNDVEKVRELLQIKNIQLDPRDKENRTPLMIATYSNYQAIADMLIQAGADVNAIDNMKNTPFLLAGAMGQTDLLKKEIKRADFTIYNRYGGTALIPAAEKGHLSAVEFLVNYPGFPINHVNNLGWTALLETIILSKEGATQRAIVKALIEGGVDVNIADDKGITPLEHARQKNYTQIVEMLEHAGAKS